MPHFKPHVAIILLSGLVFLPAGLSLFLPRLPQTHPSTAAIRPETTLKLQGVKGRLLAHDGSELCFSSASIRIGPPPAAATPTLSKTIVALDTLVWATHAPQVAYRLSHLDLNPRRGRYRWSGEAHLLSGASGEILIAQGVGELIMVDENLHCRALR